MTGRTTDLRDSSAPQESCFSSDSRRLLDSLLESASDPIIVQDLDRGGVIDANRHAEALYGYTRSEFRQLPADWDVRIDDKRERERSMLRVDVAAARSIRRMRWHRHKDGTALPVEVLTSQITLDGRPLLIATVRDLSERLAAQASLEAQVAESEGLLALTSLLQTADDLSSTLDRIVEGAARLVGGNVAIIGLPDGDAIAIERVLVDGEWYPVPFRLPIGGSTAGSVLRRRQTVSYSESQYDRSEFVPLDTTLMRAYGIRSFALTLVACHDGTVIAVLGVGSRDPAYEFTERRARLFEAAARHAGAAIERARARKERERLHEDALRRAGEMEILARAATVLHAADDPEQIVHEVGTQAVALCRSEYVSVGLRDGNDLIIDRMRENGGWTRFRYPITNQRSILAQVMATGVEYQSDDLATDDATDHEADRCYGFRTQLSVPLLGVDGQALGVVSLYNKDEGTFTDRDARRIGSLAVQGALALERVRSQDALADSLAALSRSEERFRSLVQNVTDIITLFGDDGTVRYQSPSIGPALGYDPAELIGQNIWGQIHPDDRQAMEALDAATRASPGPQPPAEVRFRHKNGSWRCFEVVATNLLDNPSVRAIVVVSRDVTERRRAEDARRLLAEASAKLASSLDYESTLARVTQIAVPTLGDWCTAFILGEDGELDRVAIAAVDPAAMALHDEVRRRYGLGAQGVAAVEETIRTGRSRLVQQVGIDEYRRIAVNAEHERLLQAIGTTSWMIVPLVGRRSRLGALAFGLTDHERRFTEDDVRLAEELCGRIALAVENAQLYHELAERKEQLEDLVARLLTAHEEERRRAAYEVHDGVAQVAASAHQHLQAYGARHRPRRPEARAELERAIGLAQRTVREARRVVAGLRPTVLDDFGLATALRQEAESLRAEGWDVNYDQNLGGERLAPTVESALYRIAQEAIVNARKHSGANQLTVRLFRQPGGIHLEVQDWGAGFDTGAAEPNAPGERVGIAGMQERATLLGGSFGIESRPGEGTRIIVDVPL